MTQTSHTSAVVAAALAATFAVACSDTHDAHHPAEIDPVTVRTAPVEQVSAARMIEVRGVVHAARRSALAGRISGAVTAVHVSAGSRVAAGDPVIRIQPDVTEGQVAQTTGALAQARAALALAERNLERYRVLHAENAASDLELDMARMHYEQAAGAVAQAQGAVVTAESVADDAIVRAPFDARIVETLVEVGDLAMPGRPLAEVEALTERQVWLTLREQDIDRVAVGDEISVRLDARPDLGTITARIDEIVPAADSTTHTFTIKVALDGVEVRTGLSARATIAGEQAVRLVVPATAVHRRGGLELVVVRAADGTARTRAVTTGRALGSDRIEVLSGLDADEVVAIDAAAPIADGTPLEVAP